MFAFLDIFREMSQTAMVLRLSLAVLCGGLIGLEREVKHRAAGFRTHILICMGAAITTLTSQHLSLCAGYVTDLARMGAQVIAGIGFIGAGAILVTRQSRIKGLTTAAGLWVCGIIGLACGAGFAECAVLATLVVLIAELLLIKLENRIAEGRRDCRFHVEYGEAADLGEILCYLRGSGVQVLDLEISRPSGSAARFCAVLTLRPRRRRKRLCLAELLAGHEKVHAAEPL